MRLLSTSRPSDSDIYVGIITSDFQIRGRWGWTGFDNASWDRNVLPSLLYSAMRVDVDHRRGDTISGAMIALEMSTAEDGARRQGDWMDPYSMDYVLAVFALPYDGIAARYVYETRARRKRVGISIEHGGRKPRRTIGPYVTITTRPWNRDCWMIEDWARIPMYPTELPNSVRTNARQLLDDAMKLCVI